MDLKDEVWFDPDRVIAMRWYGKGSRSGDPRVDPRLTGKEGAFTVWLMGTGEHEVPADHEEFVIMRQMLVNGRRKHAA